MKPKLVKYSDTESIGKSLIKLTKEFSKDNNLVYISSSRDPHPQSQASLILLKHELRKEMEDGPVAKFKTKLFLGDKEFKDKTKKRINKFHFVRKFVIYKNYHDNNKKIICHYCNCDISEKNKDFDFDHFIPQSKDGEDSYDNLKVSCLQCNSIKNNIHPFENPFIYKAFLDYTKKLKNKNRYNPSKYKEKFHNHLIRNKKISKNELISYFITSGKARLKTRLLFLQLIVEKYKDSAKIEQIIKHNRPVFYTLKSIFRIDSLDGDREQFIYEQIKIKMKEFNITFKIDFNS